MHIFFFFSFLFSFYGVKMSETVQFKSSKRLGKPFLFFCVFYKIVIAIVFAILQSISFDVVWLMESGFSCRIFDLYVNLLVYCVYVINCDIVSGNKQSL